jgi:murein DD-endopeptidase MepM/ murein hydrolase activator NlpD
VPSRPSSATIAIGAAAEAGTPPPTHRDTSDALDARVDTRTVFYDGYRRATFRYVVTAPAPVEIVVQLVRLADGAEIGRWTPGAPPPGVEQRVDWDGTAGGQVVPEGRYEFRAFPLAAAAAAAAPGAAEPPHVADAFRFLDHKFPVRGPHDFGAEQARFGAGRAGHAHQGHDVFAACGTPLVAARGGVVRWKAFQSRAGNYLVIDGDGTDTDYAYMHLQAPAIVERGQRVVTGQRLGAVGDTGRASGCHLHFELWTGPGWYEGGQPTDPLALLQAWDAQSGALTRR